MRAALAIVLILALPGCSLFRSKDAPAPSASSRVDDQTDLVQSRAAAAVAVARVANDKAQPKVVEAELSVAAGYLPRPTAADLEFAQKRAGKADQAAYAEARATADRHQREVAKLRQDAAAEVAKVKAEGEAQLTRARLDHEAARQRLITLALVVLGGGGIAAGIAGLWLGFNRANAVASILVGGVVLAGARFLDSPWFAVVAVPAIGAFAWEAVQRIRASR